MTTEQRTHYTQDLKTPICKNYKFKGRLITRISDVNCGACLYQINNYPPILKGESPNAAEPCYVYLITALLDEPILVKIGVSNNPEMRLKSLAQEPLKMAVHKKALFLTRSEALEVEALLQAKFINSRFYGEWFRYSPKILACLDPYLNPEASEPTRYIKTDAENKAALCF